jgi:hypothetical protein
LDEAIVDRTIMLTLVTRGCGQDRDQWRDVVKAIMQRWVLHMWRIVCQLTISFPRMTLLH